jgi:RNA polymerase sigma-70 factor (ECF subfamily)
VEGDERELIRRCLARDERAYRELVRTYQGSVTNLAWRITGNADDAAEVAQETFIRVLRSLQTYDPERPFRSWLFKIASNLALDLIRRRKRRPIGLENLADEDGPAIEAVDTGPAPDEGMRKEWAGARFAALVAAMPEHYRAILHLRYREEFSYEEIAATLGMPLGTVKVRLHRAHEALRKKLNPEGDAT